MNGIQHIAAVDLAHRIATANDAIVFFHKELCPHCKNMSKVLDKFTAKVTGVEIFAVDSHEEPLQMQNYGIERVPSLVFVKNSKVILVKTGLLNPKELTALHSSLAGTEG